MITAKGKKLIGALAGAAALAGSAVLAVRKMQSAPVDTATEGSSLGYRPSPERIARRESVNREDMATIYAKKPDSYIVAKRVFDVVLSSAALVALSPVFAATAVAIVAEDGRPVVYTSTRPGKDMKPFGMLKFRSMYKDADQRLQELLDANEQTGAAFKIEDDPRITKVGRFIRKYSIDELPQLVNIVKGDCSIVGPRAIVPTQEYNRHERQRQIVQPGLTCYWQVSGRANIPWEEWVELDLDYIQDMSLVTDAILIAKTIPVALTGDGGY